MKQTFRYAVSVIWLICVSFMARGSSAIVGPDTVCVGSTAVYSVTPVWYIHYLWSVTPQGNITSPVTPFPTATVLWGAVGTATLTLQELDTNNVLVATVTKIVSVQPLPNPVITANYRVACVTLDDTVKQHAGGEGHSQAIDDSGGCVKVCEGSVVTYTAHGLPGDVHGWVIAGGVILAQGGDTCMVRWGVPGSGSVTVNDTSIYGCTGTKRVCITIIGKPHAHFYTLPGAVNDTVHICLDGTVQFIDSSYTTSGSPIISWYWVFGDGGVFPSSTSTTQSHTYHTAGVDTAMLIVKNACGCTDTFRMIVVVNPSTGVTIVCPGVICENGSATYTLSPIPPCSSYTSQWSVNGGTITLNLGTSITVKWDHTDTSGFGYVSFDASPCTMACPGITTIKIPVIQAHGHISGPKVVCTHKQYLYSMPMWPTTVFNYSIITATGATLSHTDQNNQIVLNTVNAGMVYMRCDYYNTLLGCGGFALDTILVVPSDPLNGPDKVCQFSTGGVYTVGGGLNTEWTLTDPFGVVIVSSLPGTSFTTPVLPLLGTYVLTVKPAPGVLYCPIDAFLIRVVAKPDMPDTIIGPDTACFGTPTLYTAGNAIPGTIFEWRALAGTCNSIDGDHTLASFSGGATALIEVVRIGKDAPHCVSDTLRKLVHRPNVTLHITGPTMVCPSSRGHYDAGYTKGETYKWTVLTSDKGSVEVNALDTANILWNNAFGFTAKVVVEMRKCDSVYRDTLVVHSYSIAPVTIAGPPFVCAGQSFSVAVTNPGSGIESIVWDDGSTNALHTHTFNSGLGTTFVHHVVLTVTNPFGCTLVQTASTTINEYPRPDISLSPSGPIASCTPPVGFPLTASISVGFEPTNQMIFVDASGATTSCFAPTFPCNPHAITGFGSYYVVAVGVNGCRDTSNVVRFDSSCGSGTGPGCHLTPAGWVKIDTAEAHCNEIHLHGTWGPAGLTAFSWSWSPLPAGATVISQTNTTLDCSFGISGAYTFHYTVGLTDGLGDTCYITFDTSVIVPFIAGMGHGVSCAGGHYTVTMYDQSNYYPGYAPTLYSWYVNGGHIGNGAPPYSISLPDGHGYNLGVWIHYGLSDSCWASDTVYLDTLPVANFTFHRDTTCAEQASVQFVNLSTPGSGLGYLWNFGDVTGNTDANPYKVYATPSNYTVTLTSTNRYGCVSQRKKVVPIHQKDLAGQLIGPSIACEGTPVPLIYQNTGGFGFHNPEDYYWMQGTDTMYMGTSTTTYVYTSGSYWAIGTDHYGCYVQTATRIINIIQVPPAVITGDHDACLGVSYTLDGWVGNDPNVFYKWYKNHVLVSTGPTVTDPAAIVGTDTFVLVVFTHLGTDTCSDTSARFLVTVHNNPLPFWISKTMLDCNAYTMELQAFGPAYGYYNWSNGMTGDIIDVTPAGGPYRVWYTDTFGCSVFVDTYVPKDPRLYLWTFPSGCYTFCDTDLYKRYITGPLYEPFFHWDYQTVAGTILKSDPYPWSYVDTISITGSGDYQMVLDNSYCIDTSDIMTVDVIPCPPVLTDCKCITISSTVGWTSKCPKPAPPSCCQYNVAICFKNTCDWYINPTIVCSTGTFTPPSFVIPWGGSCDTFVYTPSGPFAGGWVYFNIVWTDYLGMHSCADSVKLPPCRAKARYASNGASLIENMSNEVFLGLVPNPAQNTTRIDFVTTGKPGAAIIEVYDMTGRMVNSYMPNEEEGSWQLSLDNYTTGIYLVILREDGIVLKQNRLSVIR